MSHATTRRSQGVRVLAHSLWYQPLKMFSENDSRGGTSWVCRFPGASSLARSGSIFRAQALGCQLASPDCVLARAPEGHTSAGASLASGIDRA